MIYVDGEKCAGCGVCEDVCPVEAIRVSDGVARVDQERCNECEACVEACPNKAILVVIEPAEEKAISLREKPEVALAEPRRSKVVPAVGAALAFLGRQVAPRLATYLLDALEHRSQQQPAAASSRSNLAPLDGGKGRQSGRRRRHRRRGR
ncbi:MAG TPA: 4Fe-4S dicluster domain-containing protein [Anaerolineae bacterium]|nr:4Fe-4S dicluster domain-containing protein [Anaerolineae bacterium]